MKLFQQAAALGSICLFAQTIAAPSPISYRLAPPKANTPLQEPQQENEPEINNKYFHEPGGDTHLSHYDARYFHGKVSYADKADTLQHMIRAYLLFFQEQRLDTWLAHGTLLGWWWNGLMLPWDFDLDTQVSDSTLDYLATYLNRTVHYYATADGTTTRSYLLDINPWHTERVRGDGANVIDARWIDTRNGLYIDITGLSETDPENNPGVWTCKNNHRYQTSDIYPLRNSIYEGVPAKVPYAYDDILVQEYQRKALTVTDWAEHHWSCPHNRWLPNQPLAQKTLAKKSSLEPEFEPLSHPGILHVSCNHTISNAGPGRRATWEWFDKVPVIPVAIVAAAVFSLGIFALAIMSDKKKKRNVAGQARRL